MRLRKLRVEEGNPEPIDVEMSQETLADMIGTTRSRARLFMNKFRKFGFLSYNGKIHVHNSLLDAVLHDKPVLSSDDWTGLGSTDSGSAAYLIREAKRRFDRFFPKIVGGNAFGFQSLYKRAYRGNGSIGQSVISGNLAVHHAHERPQRFGCFGGREAASPMQDVKDIAGRTRQRRFMAKLRVGTHAFSNRFMSFDNGRRSTRRMPAGFHPVLVQNRKLPCP
jgi:hypothetical protein